MKKSEFKRIERKYYQERKRLEGICVGDLVWDIFPIGLQEDYRPAVVKKVNVDECFVNVIDVSTDNSERQYNSFVTREEMTGSHCFTKNSLDKDYKRYASIIKDVKEGRL